MQLLLLTRTLPLLPPLALLMLMVSPYVYLDVYVGVLYLVSSSVLLPVRCIWILPLLPRVLSGSLLQ